MVVAAAAAAGGSEGGGGGGGGGGDTCSFDSSSRSRCFGFATASSVVPQSSSVVFEATF